MNTRNRPGNTAAENIVFDNFDMTGDDLGLDGGDDRDLDLGDGDDDDLGDDTDRTLGPDDDDDNSDPIGLGLDSLDSGDDKNKGRMTHTRKPGDKRQAPVPGKLTTDAKGNLVDATGKIVARAGVETRLWHKADKASKTVKGLSLQVQNANSRLQKAVDIGRQLHGQLQQFKAQADQLKQLGMKPEDQLTAFKLFSDLQRDPAATIKKLLTRATATGIVIDNATPDGNSKAIVDVLKEELGKLTAPLLQKSEQDKQKEQEQLDREATATRVQEEVNSFFIQNPDALPYASVFQKTLANPAFRHMSLGEVWARIQLNLERRSRNGNGTQRTNRQQPRGIPLGRRAPQGGNSDMAPVNQTYDEILRGVLQEHGV